MVRALVREAIHTVAGVSPVEDEKAKLSANDRT
jgi:hypothetical protein